MARKKSSNVGYPVDLRAREPDDCIGFRRRSAVHHYEVEVNQ
jgi:hypothetical protein